MNSAQRDDPAVPNLYYLMNFNDFGASMLTLFHIMIVNNWYLTCNMYKDISQNVVPQIFFISFWVAARTGTAQEVAEALADGP